MRFLRKYIGGDDLKSRAAESALWTVFGFGISQVIRFGSNLILTRLLFPEAFGIMAIVTAILVGMGMFSDAGVFTSIIQNKRGDDRTFLNTAWTVEIIRGVILFIITACIAYPISVFYAEDALIYFLPVAGISLLIEGFFPTKLALANRHLKFRWLVSVDVLSQVMSTICIILLAYIYQSVWALVAGINITVIVKLILSHYLMPGDRDNIQFDRNSFSEMYNFGKWIFLSTACGFVISQGDKIILGKYISMSTLGIYNIGFFLSSFPVILGNTLVHKIMLPLYRERPPMASALNFRKIRKTRFALTGFLVACLVGMAAIGPHLVEFLYDPRFELAGGVIVLMACSQIPTMITVSYDQVAVAAGDTRNYFFLRAITAGIQSAGILLGAEWAGLFGALVGFGIGQVLAIPAFVWLAREHQAWDMVHDVLFLLLSVVFISIVFWINSDAIEALRQY